MNTRIWDKGQGVRGKEPHSAPCTLKTSRGFTLIEIAIVLVIVGFLIGMGATLIEPLTKRAKVKETTDIIDAAIESVISYGASANSLPDTSTFPTILRKSTDTWQKSLIYILDNNLTSSGSGGICGRKSTRLSIRYCLNAGCTSSNTTNNVAFAVLSGGGNFNNQTANTQAVTTATTINVYDTGLEVDGYSGGGDPNRVEAYDDIVEWITIDELRIKTGCKGSQINILNNELPSGSVGNVYNADIYSNGGVTFPDGGDTGSEADYEWCWVDDPVKTSPGGVTFSCNRALSTSATCSLTAGTWRQCTSLTLGGTPAAGSNNTYKLTFYSRDNNDASGSNDNISQKAFVLAINP